MLLVSVHFLGTSIFLKSLAYSLHKRGQEKEYSDWRSVLFIYISSHLISIQGKTSVVLSPEDLFDRHSTAHMWNKRCQTLKRPQDRSSQVNSFPMFYLTAFLVLLPSQALGAAGRKSYSWQNLVYFYEQRATWCPMEPGRDCQDKRADLEHSARPQLFYRQEPSAQWAQRMWHRLLERLRRVWPQSRAPVLHPLRRCRLPQKFPQVPVLQRLVCITCIFSYKRDQNPGAMRLMVPKVPMLLRCSDSLSTTVSSSKNHLLKMRKWTKC